MLPEQVSLWLVSAWRRFCKSKTLNPSFGAIKCIKYQVSLFWNPKEIGGWGVSSCNYLSSRTEDDLLLSSPWAGMTGARLESLMP